VTRFADSPSVSVHLDVDAAVDVTWQLVCDIDLPGRFSDEFDGASWLDGATEPAIGARFRGRNHHAAIGTWETTSTIVACETGRVLAWAVGDPAAPASTWRFDLEPHGAGTLLRQSARIGPGPSGVTIEIELAPDQEEAIIARRLSEHRTNMERTVAGIKAIAESRAGGREEPGNAAT
jgi:hypothetical protein